jgi:integrase
MTRDAPPVAAPLDAFLRSKSRGGNGSGNYRRNCERVVREFLDWLDRDADASDPTFDALDARTFRRYARDLATHDPDAVDPVRRKELAAGTVRTYYAQVSAYVGWCVREGYLESNPAQRHLATEPLPDDDGRRSGDQQAWSDEHRALITRHVDRAADAALDARADGEDGFDAVRAFRDRALVYLLCYSGARGGEVLADPADDRRTGLRWDDVALADNKFTVLAKKGDWSDRSLPVQTVGPLERHERLLDPADDWPVFPTFHLPSLYGRLRERLPETGMDGEAVEARLDDVTGHAAAFDLMRERSVAPPALNTDGGRRVMKRLCAAADIDLDDRHGYLAPHGGRRGAGEVMVRQRGFTVAARLLDNSESVVRRHYSHIDAKEMAEDAGRAFEEHDG